MFSVSTFSYTVLTGLELVSNDQRNPMKTTTLGTGELIKDAYMRGCRKVLLGIGGSATSDGLFLCLSMLLNG